MSQRSSEEVSKEVDCLNQAHLQNETARDAFLALAHTALFAASVSFVSDLADGQHARLLWLLLTAWLSSVVGLLALTVSYAATSRHINARIQRVHDAETEEPKWANALNALALWSFPVALLSTFLFAAVNISGMTDDRVSLPPERVEKGVTPAPRAPAPPSEPAPGPAPVSQEPLPVPLQNSNE